MINEPEIIEINTDDLDAVKLESVDLWQNRQSFYKEKRRITGDIKVSITIQAYNQIEKLKYAIECLLKYTPEDLYELILIDNGSEPEVMELFKTVKHPRLKIFRFTKNLGASFPSRYYLQYLNGEYFVGIATDVYVTKNWLTNLLACMEFDKKIGIAVPCSSFTSNNQNISAVNGKSKDEIQDFAEIFNTSDSSKWHQDIRMISVMPVYRTEIFDIVGKSEPAFFHDFGEDDFCMRVRRAGYKIFVCRDTFVYHDHMRTESDIEKTRKSLQNGHDIFVEKWNIEPWDDILYTIPYNPKFDISDNINNSKLLCIDPRLGKPIFNIINYLKGKNKSIDKSFAYSCEAKFYLDLTTCADETDIGAIENLRHIYNDKMFDIICLCEPLNTYSNPMMLLKDLTLLLKDKGTLFFHITNLYDTAALLNCFGIRAGSFPIRKGVNLTEIDCDDFLRKNGFDVINVTPEPMELPIDIVNLLKPIFQAAYRTVGIAYQDVMMNPIKISKFHFTAVKN